MQHSTQSSPEAPTCAADGPAAPASTGAAPSTARDATGGPPDGDGDVVAELSRATQAVQRWFEVLSDRVAFSARRSLVRSAIALVVFAGAVLWTGAALLALLRGVCGAFAALGDGSTWVGDLVGGAVAVAAACGAIALGLRVDSRWRLRALRVKYARMSGRADRVDLPGGTQ